MLIKCSGDIYRYIVINITKINKNHDLFYQENEKYVEQKLSGNYILFAMIIIFFY